MGVGSGLRKLLLALYAVTGIVALVGGLVWTVHSGRVVGGWVAVEGVVVDLEDDYSMFFGAPDRLEPQIEFPSPEGIPTRFWAGPREGDEVPALGDTIDVLYPPDDPTRAIVDSFWGVWAGPIILLGSALVMIAAGVATWLLFRRHPVGSGRVRRRTPRARNVG